MSAKKSKMLRRMARTQAQEHQLPVGAIHSFFKRKYVHLSANDRYTLGAIEKQLKKS